MSDVARSSDPDFSAFGGGEFEITSGSHGSHVLVRVVQHELVANSASHTQQLGGGGVMFFLGVLHFHRPTIKYMLAALLMHSLAHQQVGAV